MAFSLLVPMAPSSSILYPTLASTIDNRHSSSRMFARSPCTAKFPSCSAKPNDSTPEPEPEPEPNRRTRSGNRSRNQEIKSDSKSFPSTIPPKPRRGRRSEAAAVEDFVRNSLERTFTAIREQNPESFEAMGNEKVLKERDPSKDGEEEEEEEDMVVEEENPNWPVDAEIGWGTRASEYFEQHPIRNVVGDDGFEIDWEGEVDDNYVQEINCLEWERFAFHPSPLVVLVFERYNRASENWKTLKELEKAIKVYWSAKDRLPPRAVKIDINIERDLAYALKAKDCPQILFVRGSLVVHREKEFRTADELVQLIAHFYYKAKKPTWMNAKAVTGH